MGVAGLRLGPCVSMRAAVTPLQAEVALGRPVPTPQSSSRQEPVRRALLPSFSWWQSAGRFRLRRLAGERFPGLEPQGRTR